MTLQDRNPTQPPFKLLLFVAVGIAVITTAWLLARAMLHARRDGDTVNPPRPSQLHD